MFLWLAATSFDGLGAKNKTTFLHETCMHTRTYERTRRTKTEMKAQLHKRRKDIHLPEGSREEEEEEEVTRAEKVTEKKGHGERSGGENESVPCITVTIVERKARGEKKIRKQLSIKFPTVNITEMLFSHGWHTIPNTFFSYTFRSVGCRVYDRGKQTVPNSFLFYCLREV